MGCSAFTPPVTFWSRLAMVLFVKCANAVLKRALQLGEDVLILC